VEPLLSATARPASSLHNVQPCSLFYSSYLSLITSSHLEITTVYPQLASIWGRLLSSLSATASAVNQGSPSQMSSSLTSGSLRFRTTSQHEPMRKPPQAAKTAVWMAGRTGWLIKHAWANLCHKIQKAKERRHGFQPSLPSSYSTLKSRLNRDW